MQWIALAAASLLGGCSLIYNPNNLPSVPVDAEPDAPPIDGRALTVEHATPKILFEGQGTSGGRSAVLVLAGTNFTPMAQVSLAPAMASPPQTDGGVDAPGDAMPDGGGPPAPQLVVHNDRVTTSSDGTLLAVPIDLPVDPLQSGDVPLDVTVMQEGVTVTLPMATTFRGLPELTDPSQLDAGIADLYSNIAFTTDWTPTQTAAIQLHVTGGMSFGAIHVDAPGQAGGPGGNAGGSANTSGAGPGGGGGVALSLLGGGGGGGFSSAGARGGGAGGNAGSTSGDAMIAQLSSNVSSGGGGSTKVGGGGGGSLALFADGTITTGAVTAKGAAGASTTVALTGAGGGGSGGTLVVVSNTGFTPSADPDVSGGAGGGGPGAGGGQGGAGRVRINAPNGSCGAIAPTACTLGVSFAADAPLVIMHANDPIGAIAPIGSIVKVNVFDADGASEGESSFTFTTTSAALGPTLQRGYNRVCMYPSTLTISVTESVVCIDVAYVPQ